MYKLMSLKETNAVKAKPKLYCSGLLDIAKSNPRLELYESITGTILDLGYIYKQSLIRFDQKMEILSNLCIMDECAIFKNENYSIIQQIVTQLDLKAYNDLLLKNNLHTHVFIDKEETLLGSAKFESYLSNMVTLLTLSSVKGIPPVSDYYTGLSIGTPLMDTIIDKLKSTSCELLKIRTPSKKASDFYMRYFNLRNIYVKDSHNGFYLVAKLS